MCQISETLRSIRKTRESVSEAFGSLPEILMESDRDAREHLRDAPESDRDAREYLRDPPRDLPGDFASPQDEQ